jgi:glycerol kinase
MSDFVLAIDQGTTNTKVLAVDADGRIVARHSVPTPIAYPRPGWVEQSGDEIWRATTAAIDGCLSALPELAIIAAIGVSNQRETVLLWRRSTGETIGPCVTWQCRRSSDRIDALRTPAIEEAVESKTGLGLDPLFPAAKIGWLMEAYPETSSLSDRDDLCAGTDRRRQRFANGTVRHSSARLERRALLAVRRPEVDPSSRRRFKRQVRCGQDGSPAD